MIIQKIEFYLFDFIGLMFPGFIFITLLFFEIYIFKIELFIKLYLVLNGFLYYIENIFSDIYNIILISFLLGFIYITGNIIKILSKKFMIKLFKKEKNKFTKFLSIFKKYLNIDKPVDNFDENNYYNNFLEKYYERNHNLKIKNYNWEKKYKLYKSTIMFHKISTYNEKFLAKYNMYRSICFISLINSIILLFISILLAFNTFFMKSLFIFFISFLFLIFFKLFYNKYKRYWKLSGDEILMSAYMLAWDKNDKQKEEKN